VIFLAELIGYSPSHLPYEPAKETWRGIFWRRMNGEEESLPCDDDHDDFIQSTSCASRVTPEIN
jgi:hypothetical protein